MGLGRGGCGCVEAEAKRVRRGKELSLAVKEREVRLGDAGVKGEQKKVVRADSYVSPRQAHRRGGKERVAEKLGTRTRSGLWMAAPRNCVPQVCRRGLERERNLGTVT